MNKEQLKASTDEWARQHPSSVDEIVKLAKELLIESSFNSVCEQIPIRLRAYKDFSKYRIGEIIKPYIDPMYYVGDKVVFDITDEQKRMFVNLGVSPSKFTADLLEWYRTAVYINERAKEINKTKEHE